MTIMLALLIAAQPSPELVAQADQASQAYITCLFAQSREAHSARLPAADFRRKLAGACTAEESRAKGLVTEVLAKRGEPNPSAAAEQVLGEARGGIADTYESLPEIEAQFERLAEICREQPDACE